jgi:hypothetical protein
VTRLKKLLAALIVGMFSLVVLPAPLASAESDEPGPLRCIIYLSIELPSEPGPLIWTGDIHGDLEGTIELTLTADTYVAGNVEHYWEDCLITLDNGRTITGSDRGVFNLGTLKFTGVGRTADNSDLLAGYKYNMKGDTSWFPPPEGSNMVYAAGTIWFVPQ